MFRKNDQHQQMPLFSSIDSLPEKQLKRSEACWAGTFYHELFARIEEGPFAVLYSDEPSRPNTPINVLMGLETLKSGFGWSDEEMYDHFCFDVQVRYALGYRDLSEGHFELRTMYNFRRRVAQHMQETGENPIEQAFEQVTDEQMAAFELKTDKLRMDSTLIASNIRKMTRLQLLVGSYCYELWHGRNQPCEECPVLRALETGSRAMSIMTTLDGRWWEIMGEPVRDRDGKIVGAIEIARDITERLSAEQAGRRADGPIGEG